MGQFNHNHIDKLIKGIDFLMDSEKTKFTVIEDPWVEWISKPGKPDEGAARVNEENLPKSQLRVNGDDELVCATWLHDKRFGRRVTT